MVLLELFTSEGCSSCPPADLLLEQLTGGELAAGVEVVPLSFHVDYWNHLGWRDPYSNADYSRRQESYAAVLGSDVFTPQLVVDGEAQLVGSDRREALAAIERAAKRPRASVEVARVADPQAAPRKTAWKIAIDAGPVTQRPALTYLFVAVTEDGLASSVARGENAGKTLRHVGVVRVLRPLGRVWLDQDGRGDPRRDHRPRSLLAGRSSPRRGVAGRRPERARSRKRARFILTLRRRRIGQPRIRARAAPSGVRSAHDDGKRLETAQHRGLAPLRRSRAEAQAREAPEQRGDRGSSLESRQVGAGAEVMAEPEGEMRVRLARHVEASGIGEVLGVVIG